MADDLDSGQLSPSDEQTGQSESGSAEMSLTDYIDQIEREAFSRSLENRPSPARFMAERESIEG
jgi:hypothetical protein